MNRRKFLTLVTTALALPLRFIRAKTVTPTSSPAFPGYFVSPSKDGNYSPFAIKAITDTFVHSIKQNTTWTVPAGERWPFLNSERLYIYGGQHQFIPSHELKEIEEMEEQEHIARIIARIPPSQYTGKSYEFPNQFEFRSKT